MAKILLIGATGFIGKSLVPKLKSHDLTCLVRKSSNITHLGTAKTVIGDIQNKEDILKASKGQDIIINLATPNTQDDKINQSIIVEGTKNMLYAAKKNGIKKIIALSSASAYRKNLDSYGKAKKEAEEILKKSEQTIVILKPTMVCGKGGYAFDKFTVSTEKIPYIVPIIGSGDYKIQPVYVEDVATAIVKAIDLQKQGITLLDIGGPYPIKYKDFLKKYLKLKNKRKMLMPIPITMIIYLVKLISFIKKNLPWNTMTIKRMTEEISLNVKKTEQILKMKFTDYDEMFAKILKS